MSDKQYDTLIIGAGAAGLMAGFRQPDEASRF